MQTAKRFVELGKKIYNLENMREAHRFAVFVTRCSFNARKMNDIINFFNSSEILQNVAENFPYVFEQSTRAFFYHRSTFDERIRLIKDHMMFLKSNLQPKAIVDLYSDKSLSLWNMELGDEFKSMELVLRMEPGQRKEGLAALMLLLPDGEPIYQIIFWIARDKLGDWSMWIGAMQGPNMDDAKASSTVPPKAVVVRKGGTVGNAETRPPPAIIFLPNFISSLSFAFCCFRLECSFALKLIH